MIIINLKQLQDAIRLCINKLSNCVQIACLKRNILYHKCV